jgi:hypothetical protein
MEKPVCTTLLPNASAADLAASFTRPQSPFAGNPAIFPEKRVNPTWGDRTLAFGRANQQPAGGEQHDARTNLQGQYPQHSGNSAAPNGLDCACGVFAGTGVAISSGTKQHRHGFSRLFRQHWLGFAARGSHCGTRPRRLALGGVPYLSTMLGADCDADRNRCSAEARQGVRAPNERDVPALPKGDQ